MKLPEQGILLRIFIGESDRHERKPLYEAIVNKAKELDLAGATVLRGIMGFGAASRVHTAKLLRMSEDMPLVIEIVDSEEYIQRLLPFLHHMLHLGFLFCFHCLLLLLFCFALGKNQRTGNQQCGSQKKDLGWSKYFHDEWILIEFLVSLQK